MSGTEFLGIASKLNSAHSNRYIDEGYTVSEAQEIVEKGSEETMAVLKLFISNFGALAGALPSGSSPSLSREFIQKAGELINTAKDVEKSIEEKKKREKSRKK